MSDYPHVQAAFINAIREEGTKQEACDWLQKQWNECCALQKEIEDLKISVIAFAGPHAVQYARDYGLPKDHLFSSHYDLLAKCGARMTDFVRHEIIEL